MTDQEWLKALRSVFGPNDPAIKSLEQLVATAQHDQMLNLAYYFGTDLQARATSDDLAAVEAVLKQLSAEATTDAQRAVLSALLDNAPNTTNADLAKLNSRLNIAQTGLMLAGSLSVLKQEIYQRLMHLEGKTQQGYNTQLKRKALIRTALKTGQADDDLPMIFKHMQGLAIDLDKVIDYQVQTHMNPHALEKAANEALKVEDWKAQTAKSYQRAQAAAKRIFLTEAKATQTREVAHRYRANGYEKVKVVSRHNEHVCDFCTGMDGTQTELTKLVIGVNAPPFHPNCQCNIIPVRGDYT